MMFHEALININDETAMERYFKALNLYIAVVKDNETGEQSCWKFVMCEDFDIASQYLQNALNKVNDANPKSFFTVQNLSAEVVNVFDSEHKIAVDFELKAYSDRLNSNAEAYKRRSQLKIIRTQKTPDGGDGGRIA